MSISKKFWTQDLTVFAHPSYLAANLWDHIDYTKMQVQNTLKPTNICKM